MKLIENSGPSTLINVTLESYEKFHFQGSLASLWELCPAEKFLLALLIPSYGPDLEIPVKNNLLVSRKCMDENIVMEDIQICSYRNALYLRGPLLTRSEEHYKHRKLQKGES